jgi:aromatic ring-opening dioxygenase LigB subunit
MNMRESTEPIVLAGLMPHAPILIPAVAGGREAEVAASVESMRQLSRRTLAFQPRRLVLVSPHSPRRPGAFGIWEPSQLKGTLRQFGCPQVGLSLPNDAEMTAAIRKEADRSGLVTWPIQERTLDHGAMVPLYFLVEAGWQGLTTILSLNYPGEGGIELLGQCIRQASVTLGTPCAVMASGDMSHRLQRGAPAGYHPEGKRFDDTFVDLLRRGRYADLKQLDPEWLDMAAEDVVDSTRVALASVDYASQHHEVLSYEGPFGVGYCVALLFESGGQHA